MQSPGMYTLSLSATLFSTLLSLFIASRSTPQSLLVPLTPSGLVIGAHETISATKLYLPLIVGPAPARVLIAAAHIDSAISHEPDEALLLWNVGGLTQSLAGWQIDTGSRRATVPSTVTLSLAPGARLWCTAEASVFRHSSEEAAGCEWGESTAADAVLLDGDISFPNRGGVIHLRDETGHIRDTLLYGDNDRPSPGWSGPPAQLYTRGAIAAIGQVWQRKRHPSTGSPIDSDSATDWSGDLADLAWGRQVRRPGWRGWGPTDLGVPVSSRQHATVGVAVGPEGLYQPVGDSLSAAASTIDLSIYTLEHPELTALLVDRLAHGVRIRLLLEGSPPGGISDLQKWCVAQLAAAGADIRYMAVRDDAPKGYKPRYSYTHAKYAVIDGRAVLVGTDNFNRDSMPVPADRPVGGRRGYYLFTDATDVVAALQAVFDADWQPERFYDLFVYSPQHDRYGQPPADFVLEPPADYDIAEAPFGAPVQTIGTADFVVVTAPENALHPDHGLRRLIEQSGPGDEILLEQLYEHKYWGDSVSNPVADPNLRLEAILNAARRGAHVRIVLDSYFDDAEALRSNRATVDYVRTVAEAEGLDMDARLGNPTGGGIHAKLMLLTLDGVAWSAVGSLNGGEISHKVNREVLLLTDAPAIHQRLLEVFVWDWDRSQ